MNIMFNPLMLGLTLSASLLCQLVLDQQAMANDIDFTGLLESEFVIETDSGDTQKLEFIFKPKLVAKLGNGVEGGIKITAIGRLRLDEQDNLEHSQNGDNPSQDAISQASERAFLGNKADAELR